MTWNLKFRFIQLETRTLYHRRHGGMRMLKPTASVMNPGVSNSPAAKKIIAPSVSRPADMPPCDIRSRIFVPTARVERLARIAPMIPERMTIAIENGHPVYFDIVISKIRSANGTSTNKRISFPSTFATFHHWTVNQKQELDDIHQRGIGKSPRQAKEVVNFSSGGLIGFAKLFVVAALAGICTARFRLKAVLRTTLAKLHSFRVTG